MPRATRLAFAVALIAACKARHAAHEARDAGPVRDAVVRDSAVRDAAAPDAPGDADAGPWPKLARFPIIDPVRVIALPARPDVPRFDVGGPAIAGDVAIVSSSQLGFAAVDWRRGAVVWSRPAGLHVAPPIDSPQGVILISDCTSSIDVPDVLLGCIRVVTASGIDQGYAAIHGKRVEAFAGSPGTQDVWLDGDRAVRWRRGDQAVSVDLITGVATPASTAAPPLRVRYRTHTWEISRTEQAIVAREHGKLAWQTRRPYTALLGAVYLADLAPMVRVASVGVFGGWAELNLLDIDATGSMHGQAAFPVPAISTLGHAVDAVGDTAIAVRMDASLHHDFIVGYAANALLMYVYPLPEIPRADPVGVAIAPDAVLVFHDGDTFTVLPQLSSPPTAPGAPRPASQNPTP
ncbi:MAG TPA: hypothetical protein VHW23_24565 [Kofleriaceae bacterium]|jgi:hypothetical protein|nr:hypothetical protein [Kofleriaceae bacterium]